MSDTELHPVDRTTLPETLIHLLCCIEDTRAFCGTECEVEAGDVTAADCVVCVDICETYGGRCPFNRRCPA